MDRRDRRRPLFRHRRSGVPQDYRRLVLGDRVVMVDVEEHVRRRPAPGDRARRHRRCDDIVPARLQRRVCLYGGSARNLYAGRARDQRRWNERGVSPCERHVPGGVRRRAGRAGGLHRVAASARQFTCRGIRRRAARNDGVHGDRLRVSQRQLPGRVAWRSAEPSGRGPTRSRSSAGTPAARVPPRPCGLSRCPEHGCGERHG